MYAFTVYQLCKMVCDRLLRFESLKLHGQQWQIIGEILWQGACVQNRIASDFMLAAQSIVMRFNQNSIFLNTRRYAHLQAPKLHP